MFSSLRSRLWLTYALAIFVTLVMVAFSLVFFLIRDNPQTNLRIRNALDAVQQRSIITINDLNALNAYVDQIDEDFDVRVLIIDQNGAAVVDSRDSTEAPFNDFISPEGPPGRNNIRPYNDSNGETWMYTSRPLGQRGQRGYLVVAVQRQPFRELFSSPVTDDLFRSLARAGGVALLLSLIMAYWISRWVASPLQHMSTAARAVAEGERRQVTLEGPKEVRALGQSFNEMTRRLQASQQSQRDFVANVSHELKTPLTSIQGFAQAILDGTADSSQERNKSAQIIFDEVGRMHRLVVGLLDLAKLDAGTADLQRSPFDLVLLLESVAEKFTPLSKEAQVDLQIDLKALPTIIGDGDRLAQVFTNLVDNALKYTPPGGRVILRAYPQENQVIVSVADTGPGIPPDELARIFERFYQVDKSRPGGENHRGIGLGLAIAKEIVHAHHGALTAKSSPDTGSEFIVSLPVALSDDTTVITKQEN